MSEGDAQVAAGPSLPRLGELGRTVARGIRSVVDTAGSPSFASSLADASLTVDDGASQPETPGDRQTAHGGHRSGEAPPAETAILARSGRDRARIAAPPPLFEPMPADSTAATRHPSTPATGWVTPPAPAAPAATPIPAPATTPAVAGTPQPASPSLPAASTAAPPSTGAPAAMPTPPTGPAAPGLSAAALQAPPPAAVAPAAVATTPPAASAPPTAIPSAASGVYTVPPAADANAGASAGASTATVPGLALDAYPKPSRDNRSGVLNWGSATPPTGQDLDRLVAEAQQRRVGWVTFQADPDRPDAYADLADRLTDAGIQPIARVQDPDGNLPPSEVTALVKELRGHGVRYVQLFDGANVADETPDYRVDVPDYAQRWLAAAKAVVAGGGLPGIGALAPDGDYDDLGFMRQLLSAVKERGGTDVLGQSWLALRGETPGASATTADADDLADRAAWFDRLNRQVLGRSLPILATLDPAGRPERLAPAQASPTPSPLAEQSERALRSHRRSLPALFAASRGTVDTARA